MTEYPKTATVTVTLGNWEERRVAEADQPHAVASATFTTTWTGDVSGESAGGMLISYLDGDPAQPQTLVGPYVGYEQATGSLDGRRGTFVLEVTGEHRDGAARSRLRVVEGSGTRELAGMRGEGSYVADAMTYTLTLHYALD
jgi:hypothetical protein